MSGAHGWAHDRGGASALMDEPPPIDALRPVRDADGRFAHPWHVAGGTSRGLSDLLRWRVQRLRDGVSPTPPVSDLPSGVPAPALPRARAGEVRVTWIGQASFLLQLGGINILTDPVWSRRASPFSWAGPARLLPPALSIAALPPIDLVLLTHDHYDHLDTRTVRALARRFGTAVRWVAPLGYRRLLRRHGAPVCDELDWWQSVDVAGPGGTLTVTATPAQHWSKRTPFDERVRLWASYVIATPAARVFFCGDSGYFDGLRTIGRKRGPFDLSILPIGAYDPRWFMRAAHMNPEEAVRAWLDLGGSGIFAGMHWGTFRLADEPVLEPPERVRAEWSARGLSDAALWLPANGETGTFDSNGGGLERREA